MKVKLISHTPDADMICNYAAMTCMAKEAPSFTDAENNGWKPLKMALKSGHESVIEHASFTLSVEGISRVTSHQLVRHRLASYSQQSQRYVGMDGFDYVIPDSVAEKHYLEMDYQWTMNTIEKVYCILI